MAKFKYADKAILKATGEQVSIEKSIINYSRGIVKYLLKTGEEVFESELLTLKEEKLLQESLHKSVKKGKETIENFDKKTIEKESVYPVEQSDLISDNQNFEKVSKKSKKD